MTSFSERSHRPRCVHRAGSACPHGGHRPRRAGPVRQGWLDREARRSGPGLLSPGYGGCGADRRCHAHPLRLPRQLSARRIGQPLPGIPVSQRLDRWALQLAHHQPADRADQDLGLSGHRLLHLHPERPAGDQQQLGHPQRVYPDRGRLGRSGDRPQRGPLHARVDHLHHQHHLGGAGFRSRLRPGWRRPRLLHHRLRGEVPRLLGGRLLHHAGSGRPAHQGGGARPGDAGLGRDDGRRDSRSARRSPARRCPRFRCWRCTTPRWVV